jgi:hypothetical protein
MGRRPRSSRALWGRCVLTGSGEGGVPTSKTVTVIARELRDAFDFVSVGEAFDNSAYISLDTGEIYWRSAAADLEEEDLPNDINESDRYLAVPSQRELNLGRRLALAFAAEELPDDYDTVSGFFRRRGAYGRFKNLLDTRGKLERWYGHRQLGRGLAG